MGIVEKLSQLVISKTNLRNKINEKISDTTKQIPKYAKLEDFTTYVDNIESCGEDFEIDNGYYLNYNGCRDNCILKLIEKVKSFNFQQCFFNSKKFFNEITLNITDNCEYYYQSQDDINNGEKYNPVNLEGCFNGCNVNVVNFIEKESDYEYIYYLNNTFSETKVLQSINSSDEYIHCSSICNVFSNSWYNGIIKLNIEKCANLSYSFNEARYIKEIYFKGRPFKPKGETLTIAYGDGPWDYQRFTIDEWSTSINKMFYHCYSLEKIKGFDITNILYNEYTNYSEVFWYVTDLKEITFEGTEDVNIPLDFEYCELLTEEGYLKMLDTLPTLTDKTITITKHCNLVLSDETLAKFSLKGYTIVG